MKYAICRTLVWGVVFFLVFFFGACRSEQTVSRENAREGHAYMVALLDSLGRHAKPEENYHLSEGRARQVLQQLEGQQDPAARINLYFQYALHSLNAGHTEEAIRILNSLATQLGGLEKLTHPKTKNLLELLAVAYLRLGEQQNCVDRHNAASCIVPLQPEAYHQITSGSEEALKIYTRILEHFPEDEQSKWLLNVAYMTLGKYPAEVPPEWRIDLPVGNPDFPRFPNRALDLGLDRTSISGGCIMEDFDNDGFLDLLVSSYMYGDSLRYYRNNGKGGFADLSAEAGLEGITGGLNMVHADYNNDGFSDALVLRGGWLARGGRQPNSLLRNNGDGTFTDVTRQAGILSFHPTQTAAWADFDGDGWLDLFVGNETGQFSDNQSGASLQPGDQPHPCELFRNNGDGTFTDVAKTVGLSFSGFVKAAAWGDINNDNLPDLFLSVLGGDNKLFLNQGGENLPSWAFKDISETAGIEEPFMSFPAWFWDYDNDGYQDVFVSGYDLEFMWDAAGEAAREYLRKATKMETPRLYRNRGDQTFEDVTAAVGLEKPLLAMGANFGDLNNDGFQDMYIGTGTPDFRSIVPNRMFLNRGGRQFEEVTNAGFGHIQKGHGISFGDLDNDGDQDIYAVMGGAYKGDVAQNVLFENPGNDNNWITLILEGKESNRSAIGARIKLEVVLPGGAKRTIYSTVNTGGSFGSSSLQQEIGLGASEKIEALEIFWPRPGAQPVKITNLPLNKSVRIVEGEESDYQVLSRTGFSFRAEEHAGGHHHHH